MLPVTRKNAQKKGNLSGYLLSSSLYALVRQTIYNVQKPATSDNIEAHEILYQLTVRARCLTVSYYCGLASLLVSKHGLLFPFCLCDGPFRSRSTFTTFSILVPIVAGLCRETVEVLFQNRQNTEKEGENLGFVALPAKGERERETDREGKTK